MTPRFLPYALSGLCLLLAAGPTLADDGRLTATGGLTEVEGSAGGGIVPWAVLSGYGTGDEDGGTAFITHVDTGDYALSAAGFAATFRNRVEASFAIDDFDLGTLGTALGQPGRSLHMQTLGLKFRLSGDAVYTEAPQLAAGLEYKHDTDFTIPQAVGAKHADGLDLYLAATKVFVDGPFDRSLVLDGTLRATKANQIGLLGFGGDKSDSYKFMLEASAGVMLDEKTVVGIEYRQKPNDLSFAREDSWTDFFIAYFPSKSIALIAAFADLGSIATLNNQHGLYFSVQATF